ncbi:MAG: hypothetical protein LUG99_15570 [Lachnospiraceae bacterium]|nr:hypothetical protein [Lachnospiraceae bacterium]
MSTEAEKLYNLGVEDGMEQGIEKGIKKGIERGIAQSEMNQAKEKAAAVIRMLQDKLPVEKIAGYQNMTIDEVRKIEAMMPAKA